MSPSSAPPPDQKIYKIARDLPSLRAWASGLTSRTLSLIDANSLHLESPMHLVHPEFTPINSYGILDHVVTLSDGIKVLNPFRVIPITPAPNSFSPSDQAKTPKKIAKQSQKTSKGWPPWPKSDPTESLLSDFEALNKKQTNRSCGLRFVCLYVDTLSVDGFELRSQVLTATSYCSNDADRNEDGEHCVEGPGDGAGDEDGEIANRGQ